MTRGTYPRGAPKCLDMVNKAWISSSGSPADGLVRRMFPEPYPIVDGVCGWRSEGVKEEPVTTYSDQPEFPLGDRRMIRTTTILKWL